jgi:flavoprotein hydroxylase
MSTSISARVVIVGYGPVGQLLALLTARLGWEVAVVERWPEPYPMPRAVAFDGEAARILAAAGLGGFISEFSEPSGDYTWLSAAGEELLHFTAPEGRGLSGWPDSTSMYQPGLEAALIARGSEQPRLKVFRGYEVVHLDDRGDGVRLMAEGKTGHRLTIDADWAVGCDGANSFVRERIGGTVTDLDFHHDWLICDIFPRPARTFRPNNLQVCDPARPRTAVSAGPGHRRWEFMLLPGETAASFSNPEAAWHLLAPSGITPQNAIMERHAVYTFEAHYADRWRSGRLLIAGDAAHLMPPFAAQGMSSGFRDAANLAWKLNLVLSGLAAPALLDTYQVERRQHVKHAIDMSVSLGRVICETDPQAARDRDAVMVAMRKRGPAGPQPSAIAPLTGGLLSRRAPGEPRGALVPQATVARQGKTGLFDDVVGHGFVLLTTRPPEELLDPGDLAYLGRLGTRIAYLRPAVTPPGRVTHPAVADLDDVYLQYMDAAEACAVLIRPDFYVFGTAGDRAGLALLIADLRSQLLASRLATAAR